MQEKVQKQVTSEEKKKHLQRKEEEVAESGEEGEEESEEQEQEARAGKVAGQEVEDQPETSKGPTLPVRVGVMPV